MNTAPQWAAIATGFDGWLALPPAGRGPGLLLWQEIFGVNAHIRAVAAQYALDGFVVLAPDVFWRQQPRVDLGYVGADRERALALMQAHGAAETTADIAAAVAALRARPEVAGGMASLGYCMGGRLAYLTAAGGGVDAAVAYYGGGIQGQLDRAAAIACPLQFHHAGLDDHIPPAAVDAVRAAFTGKPAEFHRYAGAQHGFNCWARASYHAPSAALAHGRTLAFLAAHLRWG
ncbi:Carboxymethylenebutenolidase [Rubrivivax sp. A210]|uniref:dienelactone hydrolase family protein n=1 Tax=Rubrivivax sp. A210 TaxID=2772301 RepID=UPI0019184011|nr:dienelactone hydrolase family protein [Rubrivivax sp. A210]CAD5372529.1 Carboxymethylenebutenolidase [Rubrivivax sp. A210]